MGLSLAVLVALVFVLPGAAFVFTLQRDVIHSRSSGLDVHISITLATAITVALVANALWYWLWLHACHGLGTPRPDAEAFLSLLDTRTGVPAMGHAISSVTTYPVRISAYFSALTCLGAAAGSAARRILLAINGKRDNAHWGKLLSPSGVRFVGVTLDVEVNGSIFLFSGVLKDYSVDRAGELERVVLLRAMRRQIFSASGGGRGSWAFIPGDFTVVRVTSTKTINVDYFFAH